VKNHQCGVCASDISLLSMDADPRIAPAALPGMQRFYLGHELVGEICEAGSGASHFRLGDRVMLDVDNATCASQEIDPPCPQCAGGTPTLCENTSLGRGPHGVGSGWSDTFTTHELSLHPVPEDLDDDQATLAEPFSIGVHAALRRTPEPGQNALVLGCGMIGLGIIQSVRALAPGCRITAVARHPQQAALARQLGADEVVGDQDIFAVTARVTGAKLYQGMLGNRMLLGGFDVIYDCVGSARSLSDSLRCARAGGAVVMVGIKFKPLKVDLTPVWYQEVELVGIVAHGQSPWQGALWHDYDLVFDLLRSGKLTCDGFITHRFPLDRWKEAVQTAMDKRSGSIKVVIDQRIS
jgi:threonine dehydrogenase-like Zn-dependent dehydrogenase